MNIIVNILAVCAFGNVANAFTMQLPRNTKTSLAALNGIDYPSAQNVAQSAMPDQTLGGKLSSLRAGENRPTKAIFEELDKITVQGGSLRTCSFDEAVSRVAVFLKTEGRPLTANVDLWQGPDNTPQKMTVYLEDGSKRPFRAVVECPGSSNAVSIRNTAQLEYPLTAGLEVDLIGDTDLPSVDTDYRIVQGGAVYTTPFAPAVQSVKVSLKTDLRPLNARVELLQGPNNIKQVMEIYTEDGQERPFNIIIDTPGVGNVVRIVNTATVEFPISAAVEPYIIDDGPKEKTSGSGMTWR